MARSVKISLKTARALMAELDSVDFVTGAGGGAYEELKRAMAPKKFIKAARVRKTAKRATKREARQDVRGEVMKRASGCCEHCGASETDFSPLELDHFFGRARAESVETCWALCRACHRRKTDNTPSAASWLQAFVTHAGLRGFADARSMAIRRFNALVLSGRVLSMTRGAP